MSAFAAPLVLRVTNAAGVGVPDTTVSFAGPAQGAAAVLPATATTDASGEVSVAVSANSVAGSYVVAASIAGIAGSADFALGNVAGPPSRLSVIGGDAQSTTVGTAFALPLGVQAVDAWNNPVAGATVAFAAPPTGASAVLSPANALTDDNGVARTDATANLVVGSYAIGATIAGSVTTANFALANTAPQVGLGITIDDRHVYAHPGQLLDYLVVVRNSGADSAANVDVAAVLPPQIDATQASWICIDAGAGHCTASGSGALADSGVIVSANGSVSYLMSAPTRLDAQGDALVTAASVSSPDDPAGADASDSDTLVLFRDGFDRGGALQASPAPLATGAAQSIALPAWTGAPAIETLLVATAADRSGLRVERLDGMQARLVAIDADGRERATAWNAIPAGVHALTLRLGDARATLEGLGSIDVGPAPTYRVCVVAPAADGA
jgi:uncharacterized repeat protein (TIGR01451 family)